jgi:hypothetical protein
VDEARLQELRLAVRAFVEERRRAGDFIPRCDAWQNGLSREFSRALGARGWIGMTLPARYGGRDGSALERLVVAEELLAAGAPVFAHWIAERQIAPSILRHGSEDQRRRFLPAIARGELVFALGMSEPGSGSDLASVRTRARPSDRGWVLSGQKIWSSGAHEADFIAVLCRTSESETRHGGLSQLLVDLRSEGVDVRRIPTMTGDDHFCEVFFDDVLVPEDCLLGLEGSGWPQVTHELAFERGGPERFLSPFPLVEAFAARLDAGSDPHAATAIGGIVAECVALRALATRIAQAIDSGNDMSVDAALEKDAGTEFEQRLLDVLRAVGGAATSDPEVERLLGEAILASPSATLRGGTTQILRGIVGRALTGR